jgi:hypothetical protein
MTAALGNTAQGTPFATGVDAFVYPQFIGYALRAPTTQDIYNPGTRWQDNSVNPAVQYYTTGAGLWYEYPNTSFGVSSVTGTANQILASPTVGSVVLSLIGPYTPSTYTAHGVLVGEGTSSIVALAVGTTGQVLIGATGANPAFGALGVNSGLTAHGVLLGEGNSAIVATAAGTTGQVLTATTSADPAFAALGTNSGLTAHGVLLGENNGAIVATTAGSNGQVLLGSTGADPAFGTLTTSTGVAFTTGAGALAINLKSGGFNVNAASTGGSLVAQNSYTVTQSTQTSFALPATASPGDMFLIASGTGNTSGWIITQGASQEIWSGTSHTTNGATGTLAGAIHTSVLLMCTVANTDFIVLGNTTGYTFT